MTTSSESNPVFFAWAPSVPATSTLSCNIAPGEPRKDLKHVSSSNVASASHPECYCSVEWCFEWTTLMTNYQSALQRSNLEKTRNHIHNVPLTVLKKRFKWRENHLLWYERKRNAEENRQNTYLIQCKKILQVIPFGVIQWSLSIHPLYYGSHISKHSGVHQRWNKNKTAVITIQATKAVPSSGARLQHIVPRRFWSMKQQGLLIIYFSQETKKQTLTVYDQNWR